MTSLSARHQKHYSRFSHYQRTAALEWRKIEALFVALGAKVSEGNGSRVRFEINQVVASFHRPHPEKEAKVYQVKDAMAFLIAVGVIP